MEDTAGVGIIDWLSSYVRTRVESRHNLRSRKSDVVGDFNLSN